MQRCGNITDRSFRSLVGVETLDVSYCANVTDSSLLCFSGIRSLDLSFCRKLTNKGLENLLKGSNSKSVELYLGGCENIDDYGLLHVCNSVRLFQ